MLNCFTKTNYIRFFTICLLLISFFIIQAQPGCPNVNAGNAQTLPCNVSCTNLTATFLQTGASTSYTVSSIPHNPPFAYNSGTPIMVNIDDMWSNAISLPFDFCFFNNAYNQIVVGSNGVITFDAALAGGSCPWSFTATCPSSSLPRNAIFGVYHDIDPSISGSLYYSITGTVPNRIFVINFYQVAMFGSSCNAQKATHQIVLYESTNVVEVYVQNKPLCTSWNSGNGLIGIQNIGGTLGYTPPNRNTGQWTATNEAWRFTPNGAPNYVFTWLQGTTPLGNTPTINVCPTQNTTYTAQVVYTNCNNNQITVTHDVNVNVASQVNTSITPSAPSICLGSTTTLTASGGISYAWSPASGLSSTSGASVTANPTTTTTYTVTATDANSCVGTASVVVTVTTASVSLQPYTSVCISAPAYALTGGSPTGGTYSGVGVTGGMFNPSTAGIGTHTITYSYSDSQGCSGIATETITVNSGPPADAGNDQVICEGQSVNFTASGGTIYQWSNGATTQSINVSPLTTTTYIVTVTDANGCSATDNVTAIVNPLPTISVNATPSAVCLGDSSIISATGADVYAWHPGNASSSSFSIVPTATTTYTVTGSTNSGCSSTAQVLITVSAPPSNTITNDTLVCEGSSVQLNAEAGHSYNWSPTYGMNNPSIANPLVTPTVSTTYHLTITNSTGCTATNQVSVGLLPSPQVHLSAHTNSGCVPLLVSFADNTMPTNIQSWLWDFGDPSSANNTSTLQNPTHTYSQDGSFDVTLTVVSTDNCIGTRTYINHITAYANPIAGFYIDPTEDIIEGTNVHFIDNSTNAAFWNWNFGDPASGNLNTAHIPSPYHQYNSFGSYLVSLQVITAHGCSDSIATTLIVKPYTTLYVPNTFTPDGDGINDFFGPKGLSLDLNTYEMYIYDRWGKLVFKSLDINYLWDGRMHNTKEALPPGAYNWVIFYTKLVDTENHKYRLTGIVHILK